MHLLIALYGLAVAVSLWAMIKDYSDSGIDITITTLIFLIALSIIPVANVIIPLIIFVQSLELEDKVLIKSKKRG